MVCPVSNAKQSLALLAVAAVNTFVVVDRSQCGQNGAEDCMFLGKFLGGADLMCVALIQTYFGYVCVGVDVPSEMRRSRDWSSRRPALLRHSGNSVRPRARLG